MRVIEIINISNAVIPVVLSTGVTCYLSPREKLTNVDIASDINSLRRFCKITEALNEAPLMPPVVPESKGAGLAESPMGPTPEPKKVLKKKKA